MKKTFFTCQTHRASKHIRAIFYVILITCLQSKMVLATEGEKLVFTTLDGTYVQKISQFVLTEAYSRLGMSVEIKELPARRAIALANSGKVDGELSRVANLEKKYTSLIPVKVPVNFIEGMVLSKDKPVKINGWDSIKDYKVAIRRGVVFSERGTKGMDVQVLNTWHSILAALQTGRAEVVVVPRTIALQILNNYEPANIIINEPPVKSMPLFHYLHVKRRALVPRLEKVLKEMADNGEINDIIKKSREKLKTSDKKQ